jgi:uncharacterized YigZ family protein
MTDISDSYFTIRSESEIEIKIKGSKFFGRAFSCVDETEAENILKNIQKKYYDATHHCFAYRVGLGNESKFRYSDAGEPSGTAGRPIFDQIEGKQLTDVIIIVTRYFGGTKLGTGGLTHAYSDAAAAAIEKAGLVEKYLTDSLSVTVNFSDYNNVERLLHKYDVNVTKQDFSDVVNITIEVRLSMSGKIRDELIELTSGRIIFGENP